MREPLPLSLWNDFLYCPRRAALKMDSLGGGSVGGRAAPDRQPLAKAPYGIPMPDSTDFWLPIILRFLVKNV